MQKAGDHPPQLNFVEEAGRSRITGGGVPINHSPVSIVLTFAV